MRELSNIEHLAHVADSDVDPLVDDSARRMLQEPLDVDTAVRIAVLNNRELRAKLREMGIARGQLIQAGLLPNPVVEAELLPERNTQLELRVEYDITSAVLAPMRSRALEPALEAARYEAAAAAVELGYRTRVAFYALQAAEQQLAVAQKVLDGSAAARDAMRAMHDAGNVRELDLVSQQAAYERSRIRVAELELEAASRREVVQRLLGAHGETADWSVRSELPPIPSEASVPDTVETRALRASLELKGTKERLESLARRAGVTRTAGWLPDVTADVHALEGNPDVETGTSERGWRFGGGVSVGIPLFDRHQGTASSLEAQFDALMERYHGMAIDIRSTARAARNRVTSAHARALQYQTVIVPAQRKVTEQTLLQYNAMQVGIFQLLDARREELQAQLAYVETAREYWSAVAELNALLAGRRVTAATRAPADSFDAETASAEGH